MKKIKELAEKYRQFADWLKELKQLREQEPKTGHWEYKRTQIAGKELLAGAYCSECKEECTVYHSEIFNYCPNCGAKMEAEK